MHQSLFGTPAPQSFDFDFVALWQTSSKEKADISIAVTNTVVAAFNAGIISADVALQELKQSSESTGVFSNITQEEIDQAKTEPPPMPVEGLPQDEKPSMTDRIKAWLNG
jgi:hypothetical protein